MDGGDRAQSLIRAAEERLRSFQTMAPQSTAPIADDLVSANPDELLKRISELEAKLKITMNEMKTEKELRVKVEAALERVLLSLDVSPVQNLSLDHFDDMLRQWRRKKSQVWFQKPIPSLVEKTISTLSTAIEDEYNAGRRSSLTMTECQKLVEPIRAQWLAELPHQISMSLTADNRVCSASEKSTGTGNPCEAVHYLVYMVHRLYHKAANTLTGLKKQDEAGKISDESLALARKFVDGDKTSDIKFSQTTASKGKWHDNPWELLHSLIKSAEVGLSTMDSDTCQANITLTVAKLIGTNKPNLQESLTYLASIIALKEYGQKKSWNLGDNLFRHRDVMQFRIIEAWHSLHFRENWTQYRIAIFRGLNSLLLYLILYQQSTIEVLLEKLQTTVKQRHRDQLNGAVEKLNAEDRCEVGPFFNFLHDVAAVDPEYVSFYCKVYVHLVRRIALDSETGTGNDESVLRHLYEDYMADRDETKISSTEKNDYVRIIVLISTAAVCRNAPLHVPSTESRDKFALSAHFIGSRFYYLLNRGSLSSEEASAFWVSSPGGEYRLSDYCNDEMLPKLRKHASAIGLPVYSGDDLDDDFGVDGLALEEELEEELDDIPLLHAGSPSNTPDIEIVPTSSTLSAPIPIRGMSVHQLRETLRRKGYSSEGKKKVLQQRLVETGHYTFEPPGKKSKTTKKRTASTDSSSSDDINM